MKEDFFDESSEQSQTKSRIVAKYFHAWAKIVIQSAKLHGNRIAYIDLFAGPGQYKDGTESTPISILKKAAADPDMRDMLVTVFNDKDQENVTSLVSAISAVPGVQQLKHKPLVRNEQVGAGIVKMFASIQLVPTLLFIDPWGYKGVSLSLINSVLKDWGSECIFFFNYNRINMGLNNPIVHEHMNDLFGVERADRIRKRLAGLAPDERETLIIEELSRALLETNAAYVLPFCFKNERGTRTMHHLIFVTKNFKGYEIMKEIMARESSDLTQGVASFEYSPASQKYPLLFELTRPLDELEERLLKDFAGKRLTMKQVYLTHSVGKPYVKSNYKRALVNLESAGAIQAVPPAEKRPKQQGRVTFADTVIVEFPRRKVSESPIHN